MVHHLFYEGVKNANWSKFDELLFLGHVCTSVVLDSLFYLICSSIRYLSSPQNCLSYAFSMAQKVPSQPKLSRFNL